MRLIVVLLAALAASPAFAQAQVPNASMVGGAIDDFARPGFHRFAIDSTALHDAVTALCASPSEDSLAAARTAFKVDALSFSYVELVRIGPLGMGDRLERLLFWPDPKGIALRQVQQALAAKDPTATDPDRLEGKSVAMQGLVALEYLLYGTGADALATGDATYRCDYATAITVLVDRFAGVIDAEWAASGPGSTADQMLDPKPDADYYRSDTEVLDKLAATLLHGTDTIRDQRILPILGESTGGPRPKSALFWRSGLTVPAIAANFQGLADFFAAARFPEAVGSTHGWIATGAAYEFDSAARTAALIDRPIVEAVGDPDELQALKSLVIVTNSLDTLLGDNLPPVLGLSVGFSALDGD